MMEKPIIFTASMVRAILEGRKTQTRRVIKEMPRCIEDVTLLVCPYTVGMKLWVRETWALVRGKDYYYKATTPDDGCNPTWTSPIYMPRWASRLTLEVVSVRVERVQDISEADAKAEGVDMSKSCVVSKGRLPCYTLPFRLLWETLHGIDNPKAWERDPFVWVVEFKRV